MSGRTDILIVGAGHGGAHAAVTLRQRKFSGSVSIVGEEPHPPYERPPLSKEYLAGEKAFERILIRPDAYWSAQDVKLHLGRRVVAVDANAHTVKLDDGDTLQYGALIWATGGRPRRLACAGHDLAGVHYVRSRADVDRMRDELAATERVAIVGGGFIGLEAAAVLTKLGKHVTLLEALDRVLARVAAEPLSRFYEKEHRAQGVDVRLGAQVACIEEQEGKISGVRLASGELIRSSMVVVGIGIVPAVEPLLEAGAAGGNGVSVDAHCRTSLPDVFALGDCALHANAWGQGGPIRLESVQNATDMATVVAKVLTGDADAYNAVPWFWSNQYDLRLQTIGLSTGHDETILRGELSARTFSLIYRKAGRVIALDCVNATRDYVQGRALIASGTVIPAAALANSSVPMKSVAAAQ